MIERDDHFLERQRIQLLVSDVDGTLVRSDKSLSDRVVAAARRLTTAGVSMSLISARPPSGLLWIAEALGLSLPIGAFNGGTIVMPDGTIVSAARLKPDVAARALATIDLPGVVIWMFSDGRWHAAARSTDTHEESERRATNQDPVYGKDFAGMLGAVDKIVAVSDDYAMLGSLEAVVIEALGSEAAVARSQPYYLDITASAANKGDGVAALAAAVGVPLAATGVIGDQRNDLPMFARAGIAIAMGQGPSDVRRAATFTTGTDDEDGFAQAIDQFVLPLIERQNRL